MNVYDHKTLYYKVLSFKNIIYKLTNTVWIFSFTMWWIKKWENAKRKGEAYLIATCMWLSLGPKKILWSLLEYNEMRKGKNVQFILLILSFKNT